MRSRTIREGSVGLLILLGIGLFGGLILWLRGFNPARRPYKLVAEFEDTAGVQIGTPVMYRGVAVGRVMSITPRSNKVDLGLEITEKDLRMSNEVLVETVESGLIGEMSIEITPLVELAASANDISPIGEDCDSSIILCDGDRLDGVTGPSYEELLRSTQNLTETFADPELIAQLKTTLETIAETTSEAGTLAQSATRLTEDARNEITPLSGSAQAAVEAARLAALQVQGTVQQFELTATDINGLIGENRGVLVDTLGNLQATSAQLRTTTDALGPRFQDGELIDNLELLLSNATAASEDLQAVTGSFNTPANLVLLQQTLESARDALASAQKVMADVDEITGDPAVRRQIRDLITGLGALVSSTQNLDQQSQVAEALIPLGEQLTGTAAGTTVSGVNLSPEIRTETNSAVSTGRAPTVADLLESAQTAPLSANDQPVLVFDGERYIVKPASQIAGRSEKTKLRPAGKPLPRKRLLREKTAR
ncbi:MAG: MlaD family protein [Cyanobacteria bacterium J06607_13]